MLKAFYSSATGMRAQELLIDNTANNLANVNTNGFKRKHIHFADLIYDTQKIPGATAGQGQISPVGLQIGNGTRSIGNASVYSQGVSNETGQPTHMSIEGEGFFKISLPDGSFGYTRDGSFQRNAQGNLVTANGLTLEPPIQINDPNATDFSISDQGEVSYQSNGTTTNVGQISLFRFVNQAGLPNVGNNLLTATDASGPEIAGQPGQTGFGTVRQRFLEGSNVEVVTELVNLITAQRAYEINSRAIRAGDEMLSNTGQLIR